MTLRVSDNKRFLVTQDGAPFFYLADTAWELFHRLDREQAVRYLQTRAEQGFTVIQAVALAELNGLADPNPYGRLPLIEKDPARPDLAPGGYWEHVDFVVNQAEKRGLYVALLPTWGRWVVGKENEPPVFTEANAHLYGAFVSRRYADKPILWVLGGDRRADGVEPIWRALARGIREGAGNGALMTYHPHGGGSSAATFHDDPWLSFNMQQTGHGPAAKVACWDKIAADYARTPTKPVLDGEPLYEDHPIGFRASVENGYSFDAHVRQRAYWNVFSGACGHTYGDHSVWQMYAPGRRPINGPLFFWNQAIHRPGACQMRHLRALIESRPFLSRVPDQSLVPDTLDGSEHIQATRGDGYAFVYSPHGRAFTVNLGGGAFSGDTLNAFWYNPRDGAAIVLEDAPPNNGAREFTPPAVGFGADWVLVLDDAARNFPPPGQP